ncbi:MAG: hypothetical protein M3Z05_03205 [Gemmatimonadota bacterium]|nr:hypothetical protein [Gemmatimonadota bacterium]
MRLANAAYQRPASLRHLALIAGALALGACSHHVLAPVATPETNTSARAIAVYRAIAESIYVNTTNRVVAVAATSLDSSCTQLECGDLASRWGVESLWWAKGDSVEALSSRADLLARAAAPFDMHTVAHGRAMLLETDAGDVPPAGADVSEWIRFRRTHADASGAVRMSPVGFSRSGHTAVAFVDWRCGPTCGHTVGVALTATSDSTWAIAEMLLVSSQAK